MLVFDNLRYKSLFWVSRLLAYATSMIASFIKREILAPRSIWPLRPMLFSLSLL